LEVDIEEVISETAQYEPFILVTSKSGTETSQIFICCEGEIYIESKSIKDALLDLLSTYFVFDVAYPKSTQNILLFFQHHVFNLQDQQISSSAVKTLVANLEKL